MNTSPAIKMFFALLDLTFYSFTASIGNISHYCSGGNTVMG